MYRIELTKAYVTNVLEKTIGEMSHENFKPPENCTGKA